MIQIHDNFFDKRYLDELSHRLLNIEWRATNVANSNTWPYGESGTHRLLGHTVFFRHPNNRIKYSTDEFLVNNLIHTFEHICNRLNKKMVFDEIFCNLQFKGMEGTSHFDGNENQTAFILMLSNEIVTENIGGEFIHIPTNKTVEFKQGRLIEITASDIHKGLSFNVPNICRFSIKFLGTNV